MEKKKENQILLNYKKAYFKNVITENLCKIGEFTMNNTNKKLADYSERVIDTIGKMNSKTSLKKYIQYFILTNNVIRQFENENILKEFPNAKYLVKDSADLIDKIIKDEYNF